MANDPVRLPPVPFIDARAPVWIVDESTLRSIQQRSRVADLCGILFGAALGTVVALPFACRVAPQHALLAIPIVATGLLWWRLSGSSGTKLLHAIQQASRPLT